MLYSRTFLFIQSVFNSLLLLIPNSQPILLLLPTPLGNHKPVLYVYESVSALYICLFVLYFRFHICVFVLSRV